MGDLLNRLGILRISEMLIKENPEGVKRICRDVLITDINTDMRLGIVNYIGYSKYFDALKTTDTIPSYTAIITTDEGKITNVEFKRLDDKDV